MLAQKRTPLSVLKHRVLARVQAKLCAWRGQHVVSEVDWGYGFDGMVDCFCPNCGQVVCRKPLEDFSGMDDVLKTVETVRDNDRPN